VTDVEVVLVTAPDAAVGQRLARALVEERLAACVNVVPGVHSVYRFEGKIHEDPEVLLVVKTRTERAAPLEARVRELHPYDMPEVLRVPLAGGSPPYLEWVREGTRP
jgi:periplasmic divalent cation tolerance protein